MQEMISPNEPLLELRLPEAAVDEAAFEAMCDTLGSSGYALNTDAKTGVGTRVAWFPAGENEIACRARIAEAIHKLDVPRAVVSLTMLSDDWETAWQKNWHGMPIGGHFWVRPSFCEGPTDGRIDIVLDPGMAFGTGQHATTRLCLEAIERICLDSPPSSMLDMGTGSGLLAIAGGKLGAAGIVGIDNDPVCVEAASVNARINDVSIDSLLGDTPPGGRFDLVAANILAGPLIDMAPALSRSTGKHLILSGLLETQMDEVSAAYTACDMKLARHDAMDGWVALEWLATR